MYDVFHLCDPPNSRHSVSLRTSSRTSMVSQRASTPLDLARNSWPAVMTAKTSIHFL